MSVNILIISQLQLTMLLAVEVTGRRLGLFFEIACLYFMFVMTSNLPYAHSSATLHGCGEVAAGSDTAAYLLDGKVGEAARHGKFLSLGKRLTKKLGGRHAVVDDCEMVSTGRGSPAPCRIHQGVSGYQLSSVADDGVRCVVQK